MTSSSLYLPYLALLATAIRAIAVKARLAPPLCVHCLRARERRHEGEEICRC